MKTCTPTTHPASHLNPAARIGAASLPGIGRSLMALVLGVLLSLGTTAATFAAGADGSYKFLKASGKIEVAGQTMDIPANLAQQLAGVKNGRVVIKNNRIQINPKAGAAVANHIGKTFGAKFNYTVGGSKFVQLRKSGVAFTGKAAKPLLVKFNATYMDTQVSGNIRSAVNATVKGKTLTIKVPITGSAMGFPIRGNMTLVCRRR